MPRKKTKKARKPVKFKVITIKVTARQKKSLTNFCKSRRTTPNKVIKKAIRPLLDNYADLTVVVNKQEKQNQLQLF
ncbi:MAG: hypothetical protein Q8M08_06655 [Bacteroidales bacterium]|nr:hypothetical protein [Bacteroidales bacterium]